MSKSHRLYALLQRDRRYRAEAYDFVREALTYAQEVLQMGRRPTRRGSPAELEAESHLTGQQLCEAARVYAQEQFGYMAKTVLNSWGVYSTGDFGEIVYNMIEVEMFKKSGSGHLVLISSVLGNKGVAGVKAAYAASKAGVSSLGESLRAEYASGPIKVTVIEPGYIESEMTAKSESTMLMVDNETGVRKMVDAIERETGRAIVPGWPWIPLVAMLKALPPRFTKPFA